MAQPRHKPTSSTAQRDSVHASAARPVSSFYGGTGSNSNNNINSNRDSYISTGNRSSVFFNGPEDYPNYSPTSGTRPPYGNGSGSGSGAQRQSYYSQISQMHDEYAPYDPYTQQPSPTAQTPDIYGDFNNVAPKVANRMSSYDRSPSALNDTQTSLLLEKGGNRMSMAGGELVPTPELGKDWDANEGRRSKVITEKPKSGSGLFKSWRKSILKAFQWKYAIFVVFALLGCLAALLFFVIPRVPSLELSADAPLTSDNRNVTFTRIPALFNWNAQLNVAIDGQSNWIPFHFTSFMVSLYDLNTGKKVAEGGLAGERRTFPGKKLTPATVDLRFFYRGNNASDTTWQDFYNACAHKYNGVQRPGLDFTVEIKMGIRGLVGEKLAGTTVTGLACPIELPADNA